MFKKLRNRIARIVPFMKWLASDPSKAQQRFDAEVKETKEEIKSGLNKM